MNLMSLVRSIGFLAFGWTVLALGVGAMGVWTPSAPTVNYFLPTPSLHQVVSLGKPALSGEQPMRLVDQVTGGSEPIRLPSEEVWALLTVSPWRDQDGNLEVVGRWARRLDPLCEQPYSGLGRFRLPDAKVLSLTPLDIVPTGRPCVLPGAPEEILFPSGDGQLYRCNLAAEDSQGDARSSRRSDEGVESAGTGSARPVTWQCKQPGVGQIYIIDPLWSPEPRVRDYVFVSLSSQSRPGKKLLQNPHTLWWLKMNHRYDEIQAAGPLNCPVTENSGLPTVVERFPTVTVDTDGRLNLLYMTRKTDEKSWRLFSARLELDPKTGEPRVDPSEKGPGAFAEGLAPDPPVLSADGKRVFAMATTGEITTIPLANHR